MRLLSLNACDQFSPQFSYRHQCAIANLNRFHVAEVNPEEHEGAEGKRLMYKTHLPSKRTLKFPDLCFLSVFSLRNVEMLFATHWKHWRPRRDLNPRLRRERAMSCWITL